MRFPILPKSTNAIVRRLTLRVRLAYLAVGVLSTATLQVYAAEALTEPVDGDTSINLWVDRAPLDLFIVELATTIGREAVIEAPLDGQVSGRFNGKLNDTLAQLSEQYSLLFDVDDRVLGAVPESARSNASVALVNVDLDDSVALALLDNLLPGNTVDLHEDMVTVSGHPSFVKRAARYVATEVSLAEQAASEFTLDLSLDSDVQIDSIPGVDAAVDAIPDVDVAVDAIADVNPVADVEVVADVAADVADVADVAVDVAATADAEINSIDTAAQVMVDDSLQSNQEAQQDQSVSNRIEWVTDIPGFDTF